MAYLPFHQARAYLHAEGLQSEVDWYYWRDTKKRPSDIPPYPEIFYQNQGWKNLRDWLGLKKISTKETNALPQVSHASLQATDTFSSLSPPLFQQLLKGAITRSFVAGDIVSSPHQSIEHLSVLLSGSLDVSMNQSIIMSYHQLGDLWGEAEYLLKMENLFKIEARSSTNILNIPYQSFQDSSLTEIKGWMSLLMAKKYFYLVQQFFKT